MLARHIINFDPSYAFARGAPFNNGQRAQSQEDVHEA